MFGFLKRKKKQPEMPQFVIMNCVKACPRDEKKCPLWTIMYHKITDSSGKEHTEAEGKCAIAWIPYMLTEIRNTMMSFQQIKKPDEKEK